uniref:Metaxin glutathione S-transferase domain-containing protein n=1 Tax=Acrobeloides nanus TaxID=290746 RepID=A0A914EB60_9BILA
MTILRNDLQAIETYLGDKEYFFGDQPSQIDIEVFAHVAAIYYVPHHHLSKELVESEFPKILKHTQKVAKKFFSEFKFGL